MNISIYRVRTGIFFAGGDMIFQRPATSLDVRVVALMSLTQSLA
jgi:hypothetical protein